MPVDGITGSDAVRTEQVRAERRSENVQVEQRRVESDRDVTQTRQATESGRGESVDVTV